MREVAPTANTPVVAPPRPLPALRMRRLTIPRVAVDREALLRGFALLALAAQVGLTIGLALVVAHRRPPRAPSMNRGGEIGWLAGPLHYISPFVPQHRWGLASLFAGVLAGSIVCYLVVVWLARRIPREAGFTAIGLLHLVFLLAPAFILSDVFNYIDFARLGLLHGINPYTHGAAAAPHDPAFALTTWHHMPTPYGPLFTLSSYALVPLGNAGAFWAFKVLTVAASLGCLWLVWRCAEARGLDPMRAVMFVGLNPLLLIYGLGGVHNDFFMLLPVLGATLLVIRGGDVRAGAAVAVAPFLKFTAAGFAPFILLGARRRRPAVIAAAAVGVVLLAIGVAVFGTDYRGLHNQAWVIVGPYSIPTEVGALFGPTGYTGRLTADAMVARGVRPVLSARNVERLRSLGDELGGLEIAVADVSRPDSVRALVEQGDVLVTTVGPFTRWGDPAAEAAVTAGAHYLDSTGEPAFIRRVFEEYGPRAESARCGMVTAFGYDWVPGNLAGALALRDAGDQATRVAIGYFIVGDAAPRPSGGTAASITSVMLEPAFAWRDGAIRTENGGKRS